MIFDAVYYRNLARRKTDECKDLTASYRNLSRRHMDELNRVESLKHTLATTLHALTDANEREATLRELADRCADERDDARREVDEVRAALVWLERDFKVGGAA